MHFDATADKGENLQLVKSPDHDVSSPKPVPPSKERARPAKSALKNGGTSPCRAAPPSNKSASSCSSPVNASDPKAPSSRPSPVVFDGCESHDYTGTHHSFSNMALYPVEYNGKMYPTAEHLFQAFKFFRQYPQLAEHIRTVSPHGCDAFWEARRFQPYARSDWMDVNVQKMELTLYLKFTQHDCIATELLATGDRDLVETSPNNGFWGIGTDGQGCNELGKALVRLRTKLREERGRTRENCVTCHVRLASSKSSYCSTCERNELCQRCHVAPQKRGKLYCSSQCAKKTLCDFCHSRPQRISTAPFCSRECATRTLCRECGLHPRTSGRKYCSRECERARRRVTA